MNFNKIQIAVCDDIEPICEELTSEINEILEQEQIIGEVEYFTSGLELLDEANRFDLIFLDMDMPEIDGITVGVRIRRWYPKCRIVIASGREDRFKETYRVRPLRFISKPFNRIEIKEALQAYLQQQVGYMDIELSKEREVYTFQQKDIQYLVAYKGMVEVTVKDEIYQKDITLNKVQEILDERIFVRVHQSYIVNLCCIEEVMGNKIKVGSVWIPISRRQMKVFREAYMDYDVKYR